MSYSGGLRYGYAELMRFNGIPLYPGVGPETGFRYRCKLRPHACIHREHWGKQCVWLDSFGDHAIPYKTRAQAALVANQ